MRLSRAAEGRLCGASGAWRGGPVACFCALLRSARRVAGSPTAKPAIPEICSSTPAARQNARRGGSVPVVWREGCHGACPHAAPLVTLLRSTLWPSAPPPTFLQGGAAVATLTNTDTRWQRPAPGPAQPCSARRPCACQPRHIAHATWCEQQGPASVLPPRRGQSPATGRIRCLARDVLRAGLPDARARQGGESRLPRRTMPHRSSAPAAGAVRLVQRLHRRREHLAQRVRVEVAHLRRPTHRHVTGGAGPTAAAALVGRCATGCALNTAHRAPCCAHRLLDVLDAVVRAPLPNHVGLHAPVVHVLVLLQLRPPQQAQEEQRAAELLLFAQRKRADLANARRRASPGSRTRTPCSRRTAPHRPGRLTDSTAVAPSCSRRSSTSAACRGCEPQKSPGSTSWK